ncbi:MAG: hypothetical protein ACREVS_06810 [Burkholderiales bacterium]
MWHAVLSDSRFFSTLTTFDEDLAAQERAAGCRCGGRLDSARYPRKPRGGPPDLGAEYAWRLSFCCAREGCRRRVTPPSVRYLGRRVYLGVVVVLVSAMQQGLSLRRVAKLNEHLGIGLRTLRRWRQWWRAAFVTSALWRAERGRFMPPVNEAALPHAVLERFGGSLSERVLSALAWLSPLTTSSAVARVSGAR